MGSRLRAARPVPYAIEDLGSPSPAPRQVYGIGLNYSDHVAESGFDKPESFPPVFTKFPSCVTGPYATSPCPRAATLTGKSSSR